MYWNHNSVYYPWVQKKTKNSRSILDVGCADGSLVFLLNDGKKEIVGIDPDIHGIEKALSIKHGENLHFSCCIFEDYTSDRTFDAIVFAASIHFMDMAEALKKAKTLLSPGGMILIIGLAKPSTAFDWMMEIFRVIPSKISSALHHMQTSEQLNISVSYDCSSMEDVRRIVKQELPNTKLHYALHYRYLLEWQAG